VRLANPHGACQLMCGEPATVSYLGYQLGTKCIEHLFAIARDNGIVLEAYVLEQARKRIPLSRRSMHMKGTRDRGIAGVARFCDSCEGQLPTRFGPVPKVCIHCGGPTRLARTR
jgi:hypothetical protein